MHNIIASVKNVLNAKAVWTVAAMLMLGAPVSSFAQITFTVDAFNTDTLTITLQPGGTLIGTTPVAGSSSLYIRDASGYNNAWMNTNNLPGTLIERASLGAVDFNNSVAFSEVDPVTGTDYFAINFNSALTSGTSLTNPLTLTLVKTGNFDPSKVSELALVWGSDGYGSIANWGVLQSTSAVPEPSTYAAFFGLAGLGFAASKRRQRAPLPVPAVRPTC